eukprot:g19658.t1
MEQKGNELAEALWQVGQGWSSWGECTICEVEFPANIASHEKLGWREPQNPDELNKYWQTWKLDRGRGFQFNHVTGDRRQVDLIDAAEATVPRQSPPPQAPMPQMPVCPVVPQHAAPQQPGSNDLMVNHNLSFNVALNGIDSWKKLVDMG